MISPRADHGASRGWAGDRVAGLPSTPPEGRAVALQRRPADFGAIERANRLGCRLLYALTPVGATDPAAAIGRREKLRPLFPMNGRWPVAVEGGTSALRCMSGVLSEVQKGRARAFVESARPLVAMDVGRATWRVTAAWGCVRRETPWVGSSVGRGATAERSTESTSPWQGLKGRVGAVWGLVSMPPLSVASSSESCMSGTPWAVPGHYRFPTSGPRGRVIEKG